MQRATARADVGGEAVRDQQPEHAFRRDGGERAHLVEELSRDPGGPETLDQLQDPQWLGGHGDDDDLRVPLPPGVTQRLRQPCQLPFHHAQ
ncbi:hypothetical protein ACRJ4W_24195 [Streptomyces sp. GLT-R25]